MPPDPILTIEKMVREIHDRAGKLSQPVFQTDYEHKIYGPGHNSFTEAEDGVTDMLVYHARTYTEIVGDPLWDPNRHTYVKPLKWDAAGLPVFGRPSGVE